jgi:hypothetical protein
MSQINGIALQHDTLHFLCGKARVAPTHSSSIMPDANGLSKRKGGRCEQHVLEQAAQAEVWGACNLLRRSERMKFIALNMCSSSTETGTMTIASSYMRRNSGHASANAGTRSTDTVSFLGALASPPQSLCIFGGMPVLVIVREALHGLHGVAWPAAASRFCPLPPGPASGRLRRPEGSSATR